MRSVLVVLVMMSKMFTAAWRNGNSGLVLNVSYLNWFKSLMCICRPRRAAPTLYSCVWHVKLNQIQEFAKTILEHYSIYAT